MNLDWSVESLRMTVFSDDSTAISDKDWEVLTGEHEAETRQKLPGGRRYVGGFANGQLTLVSVDRRIDLVLSYLANEKSSEESDFELPMIGLWDGVREEFMKAACNWLGKLQLPVVRIAFGSILLSQTESRKQSYVALKSLLKSVDVDPDKMREFMYRINWRAKSNIVKNININRLTTWSSLRMNRVLISIGGDQVASSTGDSEIHAVRLEIDNNTDVEHKEAFKKKELVKIYQELALLACENAANGEQS